MTQANTTTSIGRASGKIVTSLNQRRRYNWKLWHVVFMSLTGSYIAGNLCLSHALLLLYHAPRRCNQYTAELGRAGHRFTEADLAQTTSNPITSYAEFSITLTAELADDISLRHTVLNSSSRSLTLTLDRESALVK